MLTGIACFVGGVAFHKLYPVPADFLWERVCTLAKKARDAVTKAAPPAQ
jgi:hypothetical protein